ncbi:hypothetical protein GM658_05800 [Pseudoduganella eburnea]|uniref:Uncharacterized protein n=1 Tax=Massilia eburnea TaxID=1776165 RepID=A0A6L6QD18_9BURK|nr:site-specific integrase [Massilia eburnea]MTW10110.1 hypothetical protein [Massilia eburnea]
MNQDSLKIASGMLRAVVAGASCDDVAKQYGASKSAVSQRIRLLASTLQQIVGVDGVDEDVSPSARLIREHGESYLEALDHFVPDAAIPPSEGDQQAVAAHLQYLVQRIQRHSRCVQRDTALLLTLFSTAAKPLEIAQLEVRDYLDAAGAVRERATIRAQIAINHCERILHFRNNATNAAIDAYLAERVTHGQGTHLALTYRGLDPHSRLFLTRSGDAFQVKQAGTHSHHAVCKEIHEIFRRIFALGGHSGINTAMARRLAAYRLHVDGANAEEIGAALGVKILAVHKLLQPFEGRSRPPRVIANAINVASSFSGGRPAVGRTA